MQNKKSVETMCISQIFIIKKKSHHMNKYHNWPDNCAKFSPQNSMPLFQTNIFLSILNMRPTWIHHWNLVISATQRYMYLKIFQNTNVYPFVLHGLKLKKLYQYGKKTYRWIHMKGNDAIKLEKDAGNTLLK